MSIFKSIANVSAKAVDLVEEYLKISQEYYKLKLFQLLTFQISFLYKTAIIGGLLFIGFIFLAVSGAIALGTALGNLALGYLLVGVLIFLIAWITYKSRKLIDRKIIRKMSDTFFN